MTQDDERTFEQLARRNGTGWIFEQLQNLGGPQLVLLHLGTSLSRSLATADHARVLFEMIGEIDDLCGFYHTLDSALWDLHSNGYPMAPKPRVVQAFELKMSGDNVKSVLESLRRQGYKVEANTVAVSYQSGHDPFIGSEAVDLEDEIRSLAKEYGVELDDLVPVYGLGSHSA